MSWASAASSSGSALRRRRCAPQPVMFLIRARRTLNLEDGRRLACAAAPVACPTGFAVSARARLDRERRALLAVVDQARGGRLRMRLTAA